MARNNQYNPNQAGFDMLKVCEAKRKRLIENIDPKATLKERITRIAEINAMDHKELRAEFRNLF